MNQKRTWITAGIVAALSIALAMLSGFLITGMTKGKAKKPETEQTESTGQKEETLPGNEAQTDPVPNNEPTVKPVSALSTADLVSIRSNYDGSIQFYGADNTVDSENRPVYYTQLAACFSQKFGDSVHVFQRGAGETALIFVLNYELGAQTSMVLNTLQNYGIKATFFVNRFYAENNYGIVKRIIDEGHVLGSLGTRIPSGGITTLSLEEQMADVLNLHEYVQSTFGYEMKHFYYAYEQYSEQSLALLTKMGYQVVFSTVSYPDSNADDQIDANQFLNKMTASLHDGAVYLFHTTNPASGNILSSVISAIKESGFSIGLLR